MPALRKSGIDVLGEIPWGSHFCNFYETKQDVLEILVPYFKAGLDSNEFCLWVVPDPTIITEKEAKTALKKAVPNLNEHFSEGDIEIISGSEWYLGENAFNIERVMSAWDAKLKQALALGYDGMRVSGDIFWLSEKNWEDFYAYEKKLNGSITDIPMIVLCTYPFSRVGAADIFDIAQVHRFAIARRKGKWEIVENAVQIQAQAEIRRLNNELQQLKTQRSRNPEMLNYIVAVLSVILTLIVARFLDVYLVTAPVSLFFCAIMFSAWYGGIRPGLLSVAISLLAFKFFFITPVNSLAVGFREVPRLIIFTLSGLFVVWLSAVQTRVTASLARARDTLEGTIRKLRQTNTALEEEIAERKQAEEALRRSEDSIRLIIDTIPTMAWSIQPDGTIDFVNQRWLDYAGLSLEEEIEMPTRIVHPRDLPRVTKKWLAKMAAGEPSEDEMRLRRADGVYRWFLARTAPLRDEQGNLVKWYGISIDIEDSKKAEDELRLAYQRLSYHVENTPLAVIEFDEDLFIKRWSKRAEEIFGWKASEACGKNVYDPGFPIIYEDDIKSVDKINVQLAEGMVDRILSLNRNNTKDGKIIYCEWYNSVLRDEQGNVITILSLVHDVTEKKITEEQVRQSEAHLAEAQRLAKLGSWDFDIKADKLTWSEELYNVFGTDKHTFKETHGSFLHLVDEADRGMALQTSRHTQQTGESFTMEYRITTSKGEKRVIQEHGYGQKDELGKVVRLFGTAQDITERKKAEETLNKSYEEIRRLTAHLQKIREEERTYVAREIHDELGQQLTAIKMDVAWIDKKIPEETTAIKSKLKNIIGLLDGSNQSVRKILSELRSGILDDHGLLEALKWQARQFTERTGIPVKFTTTETAIKLSEEIATCIFRVYQESLTNIMRYAQANNVFTSLKIVDDSIVVSIEDDGKGFNVASVQTDKSFGILGMKERVGSVLGKFELVSAPGKGTAITISIPYKTNKQNIFR